LWPSTQPNFMSAVSVVSFRNMMPVFCRSRPAEYTFGFSLPLIVCGVAHIVTPAWIAFLIFGSQLFWDAFPGTCPSPVVSSMIPLYPCCWW